MELWILSLIPGVVGVLAMLGRWLLGRIRATWARNVLYKLGRLAELIVLEVSQTYTEAIKLASEDGRLTAEERAAARRLALDELRSRLSFAELAKALATLGEPGTPDLVAAAALEKAHAGLQSIGVVPRSTPANPR